MPSSVTKFSFAVLAIFGLLPATTLAQAFITNAGGIYDSNNNSNVVDRVGSGNPLNYNLFASDVLAAYNNNFGGVVSFDGQGTTNGLSGIKASYGVSHTKTLSIGTSATFNDQFSSNIRAISGTENSGTGLFLLDANAGNRFYTFSLDSITGGDAGEVVTQFGFTILTRNGGGTPTITAQALFSDATTSALVTASYTITTTPDQDTFYGFVAPAGQSIVSVKLDYGAAGGDLRRGIDDVAFITAIVPEPTSAIMVFSGMGMLLATRRPRRRAV